MLKRRLGNSELEISAIGLGTWALGGGLDWGPTEFADAQRTVQAALDSGINWIDTAPVYGNSEETLGRVLAGKRNQVVLCTKCGLVKNGSWTDHDLRGETITRQLESSLRKLKTDFIDLYLIHYLDPNVPWPEALEVLRRFKKQGKVRALGVCNVPLAVFEEMAQTGEIACVQQELSLLHATQGQAVLEVAKRHQLGFVAYGALSGGILSGKYVKEPNLRRADARNYFYKCYRGENFGRAQHSVARVKQVAKQRGILPVQTALAWVLGQDGVTGALCGARKPEQIVQNARAAEIKLCDEDLCNLAK